MQVTIRSYLPWGCSDSHSVTLSPDKDVSFLQELIEDKFKISKKHQILKLKKDGITFKLIPSWQLSHYGVVENDVICLEALSDQDVSFEDFANGKTKKDYFLKLGIFGKEDDDDVWKRASIVSNDKSTRMLSLKNAGSLLSLDRGSYRDTILNPRSTISMFGEDSLESLIKEVKANNLGKVMKILIGFNSHYNSLSKPPENEESAESRARRMINQKGMSGWCAFHWSIFLNHIDLSSELMNLGADVNNHTDDGWTPLQLTIYKNHIESMKLILTHPHVRINDITSRGTALHVAAKHDRTEAVSLLYEHGADFTIKTKEGKTSYEMAGKEKTKKVFEELLFRTRAETEELEVFKPVLVKGWVLKRKNHFPRFKKKFFVLNSLEGTLIYYRAEENYPYKPLEIISLVDVCTVKRKKPEILYDKSLYYFQIECKKDKKFVFGFRTEDIADKWVLFLDKALKYTRHVEDRFKNTSNNYSVIDSLMVAESTLEVIVLEDKKLQKPPLELDKSIEPEEVKGLDDAISTQSMSAASQTTSSKEKVSLESFKILKEIGSGSFGKVYKARKRDTGKIYALKVLDKWSLILKNQLHCAVIEANILKRTKHPFIIKLHYTFQTSEHLFFVMDYCPTGDLGSHLKKRGPFNEHEARLIVAELVLAIEYLHSMNILYRDLKPENILVGSDGHIRLADFGLSKEGVKPKDIAKSFCGSPAYIAPEMLLAKGIGRAADVYGIGTVLYELLVGKPAFYSDDVTILYKKIVNTNALFPERISKEAKSLINKLMDKNPKRRPGASDKADIRKDNFFKGLDWDLVGQGKLPPIKQEVSNNETHTYAHKVKPHFSKVNIMAKFENHVRNFSFATESEE